MKICIVTPEYPPEKWGGLARTVERVAHHARSLGMDVHIAHFTVHNDTLLLLDENRDTFRSEGMTLHRVHVSRQSLPSDYRGVGDSPHVRAIKMLYQSLEILHQEERFDAFHSFFLYPGGYVAGLLAGRYGVRSVVTLVGNDVKRHFFQPEAVAMCRSALENATVVTALSRELMEMAAALTPLGEKGMIVYNSVAIPPVSWRPRPDLSDRSTRSGPFRIGSAGIFKYAKGLPYLCKAVAALARRQEVVLELVGETRNYERATVEEMTARTGLGPILTLRPPLHRTDIHDWLVSLDIFVLPSVSEGCPNILMEAMACGVPAVATDVGAVSELMEDGRSGLITPYGNAAALETAMEQLLTRPDRGAALGERARKRMALFSPDRERRRWQEIYQRLADMGQGAEDQIRRRPLDTL